MYDDYLTERAEAEVETIRTLEAEQPMMENAGNAGSPAAESEEEAETSEEFRAQLQNVQKQLEALSSLPNTIQATIAALTEQLTALAQPKRKSKSVTPRPEEGTAANADQLSAEATSTSEIVPEVSETFEVIEYSKTEAEQPNGEQSASSDEGEHIVYTEEQLKKLQEKMKEHDIEWTDRNDKKPNYQTVEWAIKTRRCFLVMQDEEEVEYITLPFRISQAMGTGEEEVKRVSTEPAASAPTEKTLQPTPEPSAAVETQ